MYMDALIAKTGYFKKCVIVTRSCRRKHIQFCVDMFKRQKRTFAVVVSNKDKEVIIVRNACDDDPSKIKVKWCEKYGEGRVLDWYAEGRIVI